MNNYKPLYGNAPALFGLRSNDEGDVVVQEFVSGVSPSIFEDSPEVWDAIIVELSEGDEIPAVADPSSFDQLSEDTQGEIFNLAINWHAMPESAEKDVLFNQLITLIFAADDELAGVELIEEEDLVGPPVPAGRDEAIELAGQALSRVYAMQDLSNHDISFVLLSAIETIQESISKELTVEEVVDALEAFNNIAFPTYDPEELVSCLYLTSIGSTAAIDSEEEAMVTDDTRVDALCSPTNQAIVLAAFGSDAAAKFTKFCEAAPTSRMTEWEDVAGRNIHTLLGVSRSVFEQFVLDAFDNRTAADLAKTGSEALTTLVEGVIKDTEKDPTSVIREPRPEKKPVQAKSASDKGPSLLVSGAVIAGAVVGLTALYRKLR